MKVYRINVTLLFQYLEANTMYHVSKDLKKAYSHIHKETKLLVSMELVERIGEVRTVKNTTSHIYQITDKGKEMYHILIGDIKK